MLFSMTSRSLVAGLFLSAATAFAADNAHKLNCPAGTKQVGEAQEGLGCRKIDGVDGRGIPHGPYASYFANGQRNSEGQYVDGFRSGVWTFYTQEGQVRSRIEFQAGNYHGKREEYFPDGKLHTVESYVNGRLHGLVKEFSSDGRLVKQTEYRDNQVVATK